jgi:hypothetical protein
MRIRYEGDQATEHVGTGLWAPGETRDVPDDVAVGLVAGGGWTAEADKPAEAPRRKRTTDPARDAAAAAEFVRIVTGPNPIIEGSK